MSIIRQGVISGTSLAGVGFHIITGFSIIYIKRRKRLRPQREKQITMDSEGPVGNTQVKEALGTLMPLTLPLPLNILSQLQTALAKSAALPFPPTQSHTEDQPKSSQPSGSTGRVSAMR
jgi:hypothetical protein